MRPLLLLAVCLPLTLGLSACEKKPEGLIEQAQDKVNDALDRRPNEKLKDAAEDLGKAAAEAREAAGKAAEGAAESVGKALKDAGKAVEQAASR